MTDRRVTSGRLWTFAGLIWLCMCIVVIGAGVITDIPVQAGVWMLFYVPFAVAATWLCWLVLPAFIWLAWRYFRTLRGIIGFPMADWIEGDKWLRKRRAEGLWPWLERTLQKAERRDS